MTDTPGEVPPGGRLVLISARAASELAGAVAWYDAERPGLGLEFLDAVNEVHALLSQHPDIGAEVRPRIRRALVGRFPYGIFYTLQGERIRILAIIHSHRHPARWPRRV